jgi:AcrR family transcriptional regulator
MTLKGSKQRERPRKLPRQARSTETVAVIVEAAARILEKRGLDGFTTNAVAEEAGVSIGSLYQYFPRKDALVGALIVRETSQLIADAEAAGKRRSGTAALSALIRACIVHQFRRPVLARLLDFEEARLPSDDASQRVNARVHSIVLQVLSRSDLPRQASLNLAALDVVAIVKGMVDAAGARQETDLRAVAIRVHRAVFGYLGIPKARTHPELGNAL